MRQRDLRSPEYVAELKARAQAKRDRRAEKRIEARQIQEIRTIAKETNPLMRSIYAVRAEYGVKPGESLLKAMDKAEAK